MEEPKTKQEKRKAHMVVKGGGGNIEGLVVWGGVLVVGSLIAAFAVKKRRQASTCDKKNCNHKGGSKQGLSSILHTKSVISHLNPCDTNQGSTSVVESQVDLYAKDLILDQNPTPIINGITQDHSDDHQHIEDLAKQSIPLSVQCGCSEAYEFSFPVLDASLMSTVGNGIKQNSGEFFMNSTEVTKEEKIVDDVKIIALGMSKVHTADTANDYMARNETGKLEKVVDAEKITTVETLLIHSAVEIEKMVDAEIATSSTKSDDSEEEKLEVEKVGAVDAERTIVKKIPPGQTHSADDMENSGESLAPVENFEVMKDGEMVDTSYAVAKNSSSLNPGGEGNDSRDGLPSKENNEVRNGKDLLPNDERVIAETASSMRSVGFAVDQEEVEVKADPAEDLQLMETNDASKHKVSLASSFEEEDESDGYVDNEEENGHENYTSDGGEDSSEGTETSSTESNSAKIWSVESLDADLKDSAEKIMEDEGQSVVNSVSSDGSKNSNLRVSKDDLQNWTMKKEVSRLLVENRGVHMAKWRSWGLSIPALLLLLLLLFALHKALFSNLLYPSLFVPTSSEN